MRRKRFVASVLGWVVVVLSVGSCAGQATQPAPIIRDNLMYSRQPAVQFLTVNDTSPVTVNTGSRQGIQPGDAVTVDSDGQARLRFSDFLVVDIYRDTEISDIEYEASVDPTAPPAFSMKLKGGSVFSNLNTQEIAGQRVHPEFRIDTDWAVIKAVGTRYFVYYDEGREITWVVSKEGDVSVTGAGVEVIVHGGQQTWVEPGKPPVDPIPACRNLIGDMFPLIDDLTNLDRADLDLLCQEGQEPGVVQQVPPGALETSTPTATRRSTSTPRPAATSTAVVVCPVIQLTGPSEGAVFRGTAQGVTLTWQSSRPLAPEEFYVVTSNFDHNGEIWQDTQQTSQTALTLPAYLNDLVTGNRQLEWSVSVWRLDGNGSSTQICPSTPSRRLTWQPQPPPTDTPEPTKTPTPELPTPTPTWYYSYSVGLLESLTIPPASEFTPTEVSTPTKPGRLAAPGPLFGTTGLAGIPRNRFISGLRRELHVNRRT